MSDANGPKRLGLALSGGGFRAAFFHLGVLRRLAELDLLRHVTSISTVSGGSILAAHYYLHFKKRFEETNGDLTREDYIGIVDAVQTEFIRGNRKDLRNWLLINPWTHFRALLMGRSYGKPMSRLYSRKLYREVTRELYDEKDFRDYGVPLHRAIIDPPSADREGRAKYDLQALRARFPSSGYPGTYSEAKLLNLREVNEQISSAHIPHLILNATCLNTGGPFTFTPNEVGCPDIGYVRTDEVFMLIQYKMLIVNVGDECGDYVLAERNAMATGKRLEARFPDLPNTAFKDGFPQHTSWHLKLYVQTRDAKLRGAETPWSRLLDVELGMLRRAKVAAWYLLDEPNWPADRAATRGGFTRDEYEVTFARALNEIDPRLDAPFQINEKAILHLVLDFYYFRSAEIVDWEAPATLSQLTLSHAVAASANFPPVFTPYKIFNLFDSDKYDVIALTDGGVNDNQGIDALVDDSCTYLIGSDAGGLVLPQSDPPDARLPMMDRIIDVLMGGLRRVQLRNLHDTRRVSALLRTIPPDVTLEEEFESVQQIYTLQRAAVFHMTSNPREGASDGLPSFEADAVARIRTDLDAFNDVEINSLIHQGYQLGDRFTRWFAVNPQSPFCDRVAVPPPMPPVPLPTAERARRVLRGSAKLVGRFSESYPLQATITALLIALLLLWVTVANGLDLSYENLSWYWAHDQVEIGKLKVWTKSTFLEAVRENYRERIMEPAQGKVNVAAAAFVLWAAYIILRLIVRKWHARKRRWKITPWLEIVKGRLQWAFGLARRLPNLVAIVSLVIFLVTGRAKWLLGLVPLWSLVLMFLFLGVRVISTPLWRLAGSMRPPRPPWFITRLFTRASS